MVEYVGDLDGTLGLFARLLQPSGTLIVSMPNVFSLSRTYQRLKRVLGSGTDGLGFIRHFSSPLLLARRMKPYGFKLVESHYYAHQTRLAKIGRSLHLPRTLTADLFVVVLQR